MSPWVIVLHYGSLADTRACLESVSRAGTRGLKVLVVDNSPAGETSSIEAAFPAARFLRTGKNLGFAEGNNQGMRLALGEGASHLCLLNNDTVVEPGFLDALLGFQAKAPPGAGAFSPLILQGGGSAPGDRPVWFWRGRLSWATGRASHEGMGIRAAAIPEEPAATDTVSGCCCLVTREAAEKAGLLDPSYFLYWEDTDWSVRIARSGFSLWSVPASRICHLGSSAMGLESERYCYYYHRNQLRFLVRHAPKWALPLAALSLVFDLARKTFAWAVLHGPEARPRIRGTWRGVYHFFKGVSGEWAGPSSS